MIPFIEIAHAAGEAAAEVAGKTAEAKGGIAGTLGLNLQLFIAQLINFGIVLFILWKFVFKPVAAKLNERTDKIEKAMKDADMTTKEREEFGVWKDKEIKEVKGHAAAIVATAKKDADAVKDETLRQTKEEQGKLIAQAKAMIEKEKEKAIKEAKIEIAELVIMATEKVIGKKLDEKADKQLIEEAVKNV